MKKKQWIIDGVAYETELSASEKEKMMGWNYRPLPGYRGATDEADLDWQNRRDYWQNRREYLRSPDYFDRLAAEKRSQAAKLRKQRFKWLKVWGKKLWWWRWFLALAGLMMLLGFVGLQEARHIGPGFVHYTEPDRMERVSQSEYRRHHRAYGVVFLFMGIVILVGCVIAARDEIREQEAQEETRKRVAKLLDKERRKLFKPVGLGRNGSPNDQPTANRSPDPMSKVT